MSKSAINKQVALKMIEQISRGVIDEALVTPDVYWWVPGRGRFTKAEFQKVVDAFGALRRSEGRMVIHGVTAEDDRVAVEAEAFIELIDGRMYNNTYHFLFEFENGRICCAKEYHDTKYATEVLGAFANK